MESYLPTFEELNYLKSQIDPRDRELQEIQNYLNSDRGTMAQELAFSQDWDLMEEGW